MHWCKITLYALGGSIQSGGAVCVISGRLYSGVRWCVVCGVVWVYMHAREAVVDA